MLPFYIVEDHCRAEALRAIYANQRFIFTVDSSRAELWDRETSAWVRTILDIENVSEMKEFSADEGAVTGTESRRHLAFPIKMHNSNQSTLLVLILE